jgi:hypothetical protein
MIRKDFEDGGFPINNRAPVMCVTVEGLVLIAYNNYDLKRLLDTKDMKIRKLLGIWPGKRNTDIFVLKPECYGKMAPPKEHKDIDNAETIVIEYAKDNNFSAVMYALHQGPVTTSKDPALEGYLKVAGKKYMVRYVD